MALSETERLWRATKRGHMSRFLDKAKGRAKEQLLPFNIDLDFLESIATDNCPVFGTPFVWGQSNGKSQYRPSLDRIVPELGYVKNNVVFISLKANTIKQDVTERELYAVADWLHDARKEVLKNVAAQQFTPVSEGTDSQSEGLPESGTIPTTWLGKDYYDTHHHCGTISGEDLDHSAKARGRNSVGQRSEEVGASQTPTRQQDNGDTEPEIIRLDFSSRHLSDKP